MIFVFMKDNFTHYEITFKYLFVIEILAFKITISEFYILNYYVA